ncbi:family 43 glycosylhydrolase [Brachybacterium sp. DNPG3]
MHSPLSRSTADDDPGAPDLSAPADLSTAPDQPAPDQPAADQPAADQPAPAEPLELPGRRTVMTGIAAALVGGPVVGALGTPAANAAYPGPGAVSGDLTVHDPEIIRRADGTYLMPHTGAGVALKTSTDRVTWSDVGAAFPNGTPWADPYTGGDTNLWAPDIHWADGVYRLWYSASTFGSNRSAIFTATSPSGEPGTWTHGGLVVESSTSDDFNAIDPALVIDDSGTWWLAFGSFWDGIRMIRLDPTTGLRSGSELHTLASRGGGAIEAPSIHRANGWYYLFASFDLCCRGADSTYRVMVGRSSSVTGPYYDRSGTALTAGGGTEILASHDAIHGPGHQAVLSDVDGDVLFYHYYDAAGDPKLGINLLGYDSAGWPYVN